MPPIMNCRGIDKFKGIDKLTKMISQSTRRAMGNKVSKERNSTLKLSVTGAMDYWQGGITKYCRTFTTSSAGGRHVPLS